MTEEGQNVGEAETIPRPLPYELKSGIVNIVASGPHHAAGAKACREGDDLWTCNWFMVPGSTVHWDVHPTLHATSEMAINRFRPWCGNPRLVLHPNNADRYPRAMVFDRRAAAKHFDMDYYSNVIAYQLVAAIALGAECINLYGVDMMDRSNAEAMYEKPCLEYFIGRAHERGIAVNFDSRSMLFRTHLGGRDAYPFEFQR